MTHEILSNFVLGKTMLMSSLNLWLPDMSVFWLMLAPMKPKTPTKLRSMFSPGQANSDQISPRSWAMVKPSDWSTISGSGFLLVEIDNFQNSYSETLSWWHSYRPTLDMKVGCRFRVFKINMNFWLFEEFGGLFSKYIIESLFIALGDKWNHPFSLYIIEVSQTVHAVLLLSGF